MVKGFVLDDERLKNPGGIDHFDELLERIRDIRASEKRFYQKVKDLFAQTSADYKGDSDTAQRFFRPSRTKCSTPSRGILRRRSFASEPMPPCPIWG